MRNKKAKQLRKIASGLATDKRGLQVHGLTVSYPKNSARAIYQRLKKENQ